MNMTRSATSRANRTSCVTTIIVIPASANLRITDKTSPTNSGSRAEVGSSNSIRRGEMARARNRDSLLLTSGKTVRQMMGMVGQTHHRQQAHSFPPGALGVFAIDLDR